VAKKPHKKLMRYTTTFTLDGAPRSVTYVRPLHRGDILLADELNTTNAEVLAEYMAACELGLVTKAKTKVEEVLA
jgi:hypothetical protein